MSSFKNISLLLSLLAFCFSITMCISSVYAAEPAVTTANVNSPATKLGEVLLKSVKENFTAELKAKYPELAPIAEELKTMNFTQSFDEIFKMNRAIGDVKNFQDWGKVVLENLEKLKGNMTTK